MEDNIKKFNLLGIRGDDKDSLMVIGKNGNIMFLDQENLFVIKDDVYSVKDYYSNDQMAMQSIELDERNKYIEKIKKMNKLRNKIPEQRL